MISVDRTNFGSLLPTLISEIRRCNFLGMHLLLLQIWLLFRQFFDIFFLKILDLVN